MVEATLPAVHLSPPDGDDSSRGLHVRGGQRTFSPAAKYALLTTEAKILFLLYSFHDSLYPFCPLVIVSV